MQLYRESGWKNLSVLGWLNANFGVWMNSTGWTRYRSAQGDCLISSTAMLGGREGNNQGGTAMIRPCMLQGRFLFVFKHYK